MNNELELNIKTNNFDYNLHTLLYLITIIARIYDEKIKSENQELFKLIQFIIQHQYKTIKDGLFLLHLCSSSSTISFSEEIR